MFWLRNNKHNFRYALLSLGLYNVVVYSLFVVAAIVCGGFMLAPCYMVLFLVSFLV